ncbi:MAG TPA: indole-3-glycerol phosphate synthase TrpC [Chthoniobacteraceae bacterium]|nr:indole-3-glycerol phosphate synthase TrpC [Chthoniobacteraceae bacterium]
MNRLQVILDQKQLELAKLLPRREHLRAAALLRNDYRGFAAAIDRGPDALGLIAEVKKASPSAGSIVEAFDPVAIAQAYEAAGAHAISVLTDEKFFQGALSYMTQVRAATNLPVLRKDFIIHEVQIYEAAVAGADAVLLIVAALEQELLEELHKTATTLGLDVLVEVHTAPELERALEAGATLIGINNRNLTTFEVDLKATEEISEEVPEEGILLVSESGIKTNADTRRVFAAGANAILVGESLMRSNDIPGQVAALLNVDGES